MVLIQDLLSVVIFLKQPCINLYKLNKSNEKFPSTQEIEDRGFFIGL